MKRVEMMGRILGVAAILCFLLAMVTAMAGAQSNKPVTLSITNQSSDRVAIYIAGDNVLGRRIATVDVGETTRIKLTDRDVSSGVLEVIIQPMGRDAERVPPIQVGELTAIRLTVQTPMSRLTPDWGR